MVEDQFRPNPAKGLEASVAYAEGYARSHRSELTLDYKRGYICSLLIDALLTDYVLLEVGCGTGGYLRLANNHKRIVGLDFSRTMIDQGRKLASELGLERIEFVHDKFESFRSPELFDVINLGGVVGWYAPWIGNEHVLEKVRAMLRPQGMAVFSFVKPRNWFHEFKALLFPRRTVLIREERFLRLVEGAGFQVAFLVDAIINVYVFCLSSELASK